MLAKISVAINESIKRSINRKPSPVSFSNPNTTLYKRVQGAAATVLPVPTASTNSRLLYTYHTHDSKQSIQQAMTTVSLSPNTWNRIAYLLVCSSHPIPSHPIRTLPSLPTYLPVLNRPPSVVPLHFPSPPHPLSPFPQPFKLSLLSTTVSLL